MGPHVFDDGGSRKAVLSQANARALQISPDLFVLCAVEAVLFQEGAKCLFICGFGFAARQHRIEERLHHVAQLRLSAAGRSEFIQLGTAQRRKRAPFLAQQLRHGQRIVARRHQGVRAIEQNGLGAALVDGKIVHYRLHGEGKRVLQLALRAGHDFLQALLRARLLFRRKDESHSAAGHAA